MNEPWADLVVAYREQLELRGETIDRGWQELSARVGAGQTSALGTELAVGTTTKLAVVAVVAIAGVLTAVAVRMAWPSDTPDPSIAAAAESAVHEPELVSSVPVLVPVPVGPSAAGSFTPEPPKAIVPSKANEQAIPSHDGLGQARRTTTGKSRGKRRTEAPPSEPHDAGSLEAELGLLRDVRAALRAGDSTRALELVAQHRQRFPKSTFAEERSLTEISALCALGRRDDAQRKADRFRRRFPSSKRAAKALRSCDKQRD